ncbi:peptidoglycan-binding domain-containing protein [Streptomyces sp. TG1A-60]|uniref:peptidoglycan-binding domain-containing protein n=1 Tax=Streptomyces sp. TG1A-60 TaxID=3129111 RepID=UPI0030D44297
MSEPTAPACPQCDTPRAADGTPACSCGRLASDAHRDTRTAQAEAAEDFDPVRIRPFVNVGDDTADPDGPQRPSPVEEGEVPLPPVEPHGGAPTRPHAGGRSPLGSAPAGPRRRRRAALAAGVGAAAAAVLVTGGVIGGLFSYEAPSRDGSAPGDVRAGLPEAAPDATPSSSATPSGPASSPPPSGAASTFPAITPTETGPTPTDPTTPTRTPSNSGTTGTAAPAPPDAQPPVLSLGDTGPEVTELQLRLRQTNLYNGPVDGHYDRDVERAVRGYQLTRVVLADEPGVYGEATRTSLESETSKP